jgi:uncharacterized protein YpmS
MRKMLFFCLMALTFGLLVGAAAKLITKDSKPIPMATEPVKAPAAAVVNTARRDIEDILTAAADYEVPFNIMTAKVMTARVRPTTNRDWRIRPKRFV